MPSEQTTGANVRKIFSVLFVFCVITLAYFFVIMPLGIGRVFFNNNPQLIFAIKNSSNWLLAAAILSAMTVLLLSYETPKKVLWTVFGSFAICSLVLFLLRQLESQFDLERAFNTLPFWISIFLFFLVSLDFFWPLPAAILSALFSYFRLRSTQAAAAPAVPVVTSPPHNVVLRYLLTLAAAWLPLLAFLSLIFITKPVEGGGLATAAIALLLIIVATGINIATLLYFLSRYGLSTIALPSLFVLLLYLYMNVL